MWQRIGPSRSSKVLSMIPEAQVMVLLSSMKSCRRGFVIGCLQTDGRSWRRKRNSIPGTVLISWSKSSFIAICSGGWMLVVMVEDVIWKYQQFFFERSVNYYNFKYWIIKFASTHCRCGRYSFKRDIVIEYKSQRKYFTNIIKISIK